jgi:malate dehydrogenase (oxaloacetate-decarboxylating)
VFGGLDSIPIVLASTDVDEVVETLVRLRPSFGAVNREDVSAPRCFELEAKLIKALDCPVMHDDQHGTAVVVLAALTTAVKLTGRSASTTKVVIAGAGAAGVACANILVDAGIRDIVVDSQGIISPKRTDLSVVKEDLLVRTNPRRLSGTIADALFDADVFIGVSSSSLEERHLELMAPESIVFALSNPTPEISPDIAARHASVVATGRSDYANQINNVLAFPRIFRGALDSGAPGITTSMKVAAVAAIAELVGDDLSVDYIIPSPLDPRVAPAVTAAVIAAAEYGV